MGRTIDPRSQSIGRGDTSEVGSGMCSVRTRMIRLMSRPRCQLSTWLPAREEPPRYSNTQKIRLTPAPKHHRYSSGCQIRRGAHEFRQSFGLASVWKPIRLFLEPVALCRSPGEHDSSLSLIEPATANPKLQLSRRTT